MPCATRWWLGFSGTVMPGWAAASRCASSSVPWLRGGGLEAIRSAASGDDRDPEPGARSSPAVCPELAWPGSGIGRERPLILPANARTVELSAKFPASGNLPRPGFVSTV